MLLETIITRYRFQVSPHCTEQAISFLYWHHYFVPGLSCVNMTCECTYSFTNNRHAHSSSTCRVNVANILKWLLALLFHFQLKQPITFFSAGKSTNCVTSRKSAQSKKAQYNPHRLYQQCYALYQLKNLLENLIFLRINRFFLIHSLLLILTLVPGQCE